MKPAINTRVLDLAPYIPGKSVDVLMRELGIQDAIKLASNENPRGPSSKVLEAISKTTSSLSRYPDPDGFHLKAQIAERLEIQSDHITLGNGSNDILELAARVAMSPGSEGIVDEYCFVVYPLAIAGAHGHVRVVPSNNWAHDLDRMIDAITEDTRIVFLANPNNPTGTYFTDSELSSFLDQIPSYVWVVIDEAYFEYVSAPDYPNGLKYVKEYENVIVTRTFSKAYGLAGLRIGYSISSTYCADLLNRVRQPFNANSIALAAAEAALLDENYLSESIQMNREEMRFLEDSFRKLGYEFIPSLGNFVCIDTGGDASTLNQALLEKGVIVRPVANYKMPNHLRVTVGTHDENTRFIDALGQIG